MDVLDSPLEALAFNDLSFGFLTAVNNIWTWVAVVTAAVGFWRIRAAGGAGTPLSDPIRRFPDGSPPPPPPATAVNSEPASTSAPSTTTRASAPAPAPSVRAPETAEGVTTRGKFTVYYEDDREVDDGCDGGFGEVGSGGGGGGEYWCEGWKWERVMKMRMGDDMGWYLYQDLTVLDGNVVRLWDGCRERRSITPAGVSFSGSSAM